MRQNPQNPDFILRLFAFKINQASRGLFWCQWFSNRTYLCEQSCFDLSLIKLRGGKPVSTYLEKIEALLLAGYLDKNLNHSLWRRGCLMVSAFASDSRGMGSKTGRGHCVMFLARHLESQCLSLRFTQVYKWVPANWMLAGTLWWTSIPSRGKQK